MARALLLFAAAVRQASSAVRQGQRLRIMSWNVHAWRDSEHRDNFEGVLETCRSVDADIVCLNEVLHPYDLAAQDGAYLATVKAGKGVGLEVVPCAKGQSYLERLAVGLGMPHVAFVEAERAKCFFGAAPFGNAILSKRPFVDAGHVALTSEPGDAGLGDQPRDAGCELQALMRRARRVVRRMLF